MNTTQVNIIVFDRDQDTIIENILVLGQGADDAEQIFLDKCSDHFTNWDEYTLEDRKAILDNGYEQSTHKIVFICWPDVVDKR